MSSPIISPPQLPGTSPMAPPYQQQMSASVAVINGATTGAQTIVTGVAGKTIKVYRMYFVVSGATNVTFTDGTNTDGALPMGANGSLTFDTQANGDPWFQTALGSGFQITTSSAVTIVGRAYYLTSPF